MSNAAIEVITQQIEQKRHEINALRAALDVLQGNHVPPTSTGDSRSRAYDGLGIVDAAIRYLTEVGEPRSTGEIKDALLNGGWTTRSKNATATVYATLDNSKRLTRTNDGRWALKALPEVAA
jgi:hypothetical protein